MQQNRSFLYVVLTILCFIVNYFPELVVPAGLIALYSTGLLSAAVGNESAMAVIKALIPICIAAAFVLSFIITIFVWNHYEETVSRGIRRWISNVKFFQNRLGFTITTLFETFLIGLILIYSITAMALSLIHSNLAN